MGSAGWESEERRSGTPAILGKVVFWRIPGDWGNVGRGAGRVWLGAVVCVGGVVYRPGGVGRECGAALWHACGPGEGGFLADSGGLGKCGECEAGVVRRSGVRWRDCIQVWWAGREWGAVDGESGTGRKGVFPRRASKKHPHQRVLSLRAYSKKPKSEKGKMVNTARLMTSSASI